MHDVELPYPDAKVAEKLCGGGACFYLPYPRYDIVMLNSFLLNHVVPNVKKRLPELAYLVLGRALLWLICSPLVDNHVPTDLKDKVLADWAHIRCGSEVDTPAPPVLDNEEQESNPIQQVTVIVSGDHGAVVIDTIGNLEGKGARGVGHQHGTNVTVRNQLIGVQSCLLSMQQENLELKYAINAMKVNMERSFQMVNGNIRRLAMRTAARRTSNTAPAVWWGDHAMMLATLMPTPRSLMTSGRTFSTGLVG